MPDDRRYTEAELHAIFERAAKRQEAATRAEEASRAGLTLAELQEIGAASGIDPAHVAAAAADLEALPPRAGNEALGLPDEIRRERALLHPVSDEAWERMVAELRRTFEQPGVAGKVGRVREWTTAPEDDLESVRVTARPDGGGTRIGFEQPLRRQRDALKPGIVTGLAMTLGMTLFLAWGDFPGHYPLLIPALIAVMASGMLGFQWKRLRSHADRQGQRFDALLDRFDLIARDAMPEAEATTRPERGSRLDLDSLSGTEQESAPAERRRTRS